MRANQFLLDEFEDFFPSILNQFTPFLGRPPSLRIGMMFRVASPFVRIPLVRRMLIADASILFRRQKDKVAQSVDEFPDPDLMLFPFLRREPFLLRVTVDPFKIPLFRGVIGISDF